MRCFLVCYCALFIKSDLLSKFRGNSKWALFLPICEVRPLWKSWWDTTAKCQLHSDGSTWSHWLCPDSTSASCDRPSAITQPRLHLHHLKATAFPTFQFCVMPLANWLQNHSAHSSFRPHSHYWDHPSRYHGLPLAQFNSHSQLVSFVVNSAAIGAIRKCLAQTVLSSLQSQIWEDGCFRATAP